jgi:hypothetical protein
MSNPITKVLEDLNEKLMDYDTEIAYLEELLVGTSGPAEDTIKELDSLRAMRRQVQVEYSKSAESIWKAKDEN